MARLKSLVKDTALYGVSSILGRFLNWCLVPLYTYKLPVEAFGSITNLYSWMALLLILLTYGLETGFFRFANSGDDTNPHTVFSTCLTSLLVTSSLFIGVVLLFLFEISTGLGYGTHPEYIAMIALIIGIDAFTSLPFAYLRYEHRAWRFVAIKMSSIVLMILLNLFFILWAPIIYKHYPSLIDWFYNPNYGVGYILVSNTISSLFVLISLFPDIFRFRWQPNLQLLKRILRYSFPLLILGLAGIMNQTLDKILIPFLIPNEQEALEQLGIYGANYKIAIVMVMFIQAFRYAYEPFIFARHQGEDKRTSYAETMTYFILFGLLIFLGVMFFLDILRYFIDPLYFSGLKIVPIVMIAELFFGIFFNLSLWYKLTDRTAWGAYFSLLGLGITLTINVIFVPRIGYMACAWAALACYSVMMLSSYFVGQHYYPIRYNLSLIGKCTLLAAVLYGIAMQITIDSLLYRLIFRTGLLILYVGAILYWDKTLRSIITKIVGKVS